VKIEVVLPSSASEPVADRRAAYARYARSDTEIAARALHQRVPGDADPSDAFIVPEILEQVMAAVVAGADAVIVDCMEDPAVEEARRLVRVPVVGPGHAAMSLAAILSYRFSILYPLPQLRLIERLVIAHGLAPMVASIRHLSCGLAAIRDDAEATLECMVSESVAAVRHDGAHAIVPACTLTSALTHELARRLSQQQCPIPVVDGPGAAVKLAENLVAMGLTSSRVTYPAPLGICQAIR
jgi:allantoin racemase